MSIVNICVKIIISIWKLKLQQLTTDMLNIIISVVWYKVDKAVAWCRERRKVELL